KPKVPNLKIELSKIGTARITHFRKHEQQQSEQGFVGFSFWNCFEKQFRQNIKLKETSIVLQPQTKGTDQIGFVYVDQLLVFLFVTAKLNPVERLQTTRKGTSYAL